MRIEIPVSLLQFCETVDVLFGFHPIRRIAKAPLLIRVQRLVYLIKPGSAAVFPGNDTLTHKDGVSRRGIFGGYFPVPDIRDGLRHIPVQRIHMFLFNTGPKNLQLFIGKLIFQLKKAASLRFIGRSRTLANIRLVNGTFEFISHVIPGSK